MLFACSRAALYGAPDYFTRFRRITMALAEFQNEPFTDFSKPENAAAMQLALAEVKAQFGRTYPLIIDGEKIPTATTIASITPAEPSQVVGYAASASAEQAAQAIE